MPRIARAGVDTAGGVIIQTSGQTLAEIDGFPVAVVGDRLPPHGPPPHDRAVFTAGSPLSAIDGVAVIREGDAATCGHVATASAPVFDFDLTVPAGVGPGLADQVMLQEALAVVGGVPLSGLYDSAPPVELLAATAGYAVDLGDVALPADLLAEFGVELADAAVVAEGLVAATGYAVNLADDARPVDALTHDFSGLADDARPADAMAAAVGYAVALADAAVRYAGFGFDAAGHAFDQGNFAPAPELLAVRAGYAVALADTVRPADNLGIGREDISLADTAAPVDSIGVSRENVSLTDTARPSLAIGVSREAIALADTATPVDTMSLRFSEPVSLADAALPADALAVIPQHFGFDAAGRNWWQARFFTLSPPPPPPIPTPAVQTYERRVSGNLNSNSSPAFDPDTRAFDVTRYADYWLYQNTSRNTRVRRVRLDRNSAPMAITYWHSDDLPPAENLTIGTAAAPADVSVTIPAGGYVLVQVYGSNAGQGGDYRLRIS